MAPAPDNAAIAAAFEEVSVLLELTGDNPHRVRSYASIARTIEGLPEPAATMLAAGTLTDVKGVGEGTAARVKELATTGRLALLDELRAKVPAGVLEILKVPGLGPKRAREIWQSLIETLATDIATHLLANHALCHVALTIEKHILPNTECVAVHIERGRRGSPI